MPKIEQPTYNRIEFTANLGFGEVVLAFVDFSDAGISFGIPHNVLIHGGTPEEPSEIIAIKEYERITVHADGKVVTHLALPQGNNFIAPWDINKSPLASWDLPWSMRKEISWAPEDILFTKAYFTKPKPLSHVTCFRVPVKFNYDASNSVLCFAVLKPTDDLEKLKQMIPFQEQTYVLNGGWPWVIVAASNVNTPNLVQIPVGRDYR